MGDNIIWFPFRDHITDYSNFSYNISLEVTLYFKAECVLKNMKYCNHEFWISH